MEITVNGEKKSVITMSVLQFLQSLEIDSRRVAVEYNRGILPKSSYETTVLQDGDQLEIVHFVGGG
jgi:thiamine biosynthesis protein ThiS